MESTGIDPVFVARLLEERGVVPPAPIVDVGCGTGRHARELAARGYRAAGVDRSSELIAEARRAPTSAELVVGDLLNWRPATPVAAVLCRGVLNDLVEEGDREAAFPSLAGMLEPGGVLVVDVRDWDLSFARYRDGRQFERRSAGAAGEVTFRSKMHADAERCELVADETIDAQGTEYRSEFRMKPWTWDELAGQLSEAAFVEVERLGPGATGAREDRIVVVARRR